MVQSKVKICTRCLVEKPRNNQYFTTNKASKDGLSSWCKDCYKDYQRSRQLPSNYASLRAGIVDDAAMQRAAELMSEIEDRNRERQILHAWGGRYRAAYIACYCAARRARKYNATVIDLTPDEWLRIKESQNGVCALCGDQFDDLHIDHKISLSKGGDHTPGNVHGVCQRCNSQKSTASLEEFLEIKKRKSECKQQKQQREQAA